LRAVGKRQSGKSRLMGEVLVSSIHARYGPGTHLPEGVPTMEGIEIRAATVGGIFPLRASAID
jgi:hypothetical protein